MPIDAALLGTWQGATSTIKFAEDDYLYLLGSAQASISADGMELTESTTVYGRVYGNGDDIVGVWKMRQNENGAIMIEEVTYRDDGSYFSTWTKDGAFDSLAMGYYVFANGTLAKEERRALVTTGSAGAIDLDYPFDADQSGNYAFDANGALLLTVGGNTSTFTKIIS